MYIISEYIKLSIIERQSHLDLAAPCLERGGSSTNHRGVLAEFLNSEIPMGRVALLCHKCNNPKCSNPKHLYWGTDYENNIIDPKESGTYKSIYQKTVEKYGMDIALQTNKENGFKFGNSGGCANKGKPKSAEQRRKISESLKGNKNASKD